jgi:hypothetical protein
MLPEAAPFSHLLGLISFDHVDDRSFSSAQVLNNHKTTCSYTTPLICTIAQSHPNSASSRLAHHLEAPRSLSIPCSLQRIAAIVVQLNARIPSCYGSS